MGAWSWAELRDAGRKEKGQMYLASSIDNLGRKFLILVFDHLAKRVLDGRIVAVYEVTVDELNRQTRLACPELGGQNTGLVLLACEGCASCA